MFIASCRFKASVEPIDSGSTSSSIAGVSWGDNKDYCVRVKNESSVNLVAFKGIIEKATLLGGVLSGATAGLKLVPELFTDSCDFALQFITEEQYKANANDLSKVKNAAFTSCYAFYNKNDENNILYRISSKLGGAAKLA